MTEKSTHKADREVYFAEILRAWLADETLTIAQLSQRFTRMSRSAIKKRLKTRGLHPRRHIAWSESMKNVKTPDKFGGRFSNF